MRTVIQRVAEASVRSGTSSPARIGKGLVVLVGIEEGDDRETVREFADRILSFRIFPDGSGKMNRDLREVAGALLLVPNFTLCAETSSGNRPGFAPAANPDRAEKLFEDLSEHLKAKAPATVRTGSFGTEMEVSLLNDGPVTFILED